MNLSDKAEYLLGHYSRLYENSMYDLPIVNKALRVQLVDFFPWSDSLLGVLITPWFMNLVLIPKVSHERFQSGKTVRINISGSEFMFLANNDDTIGLYLSSSLYSPMFEYKTQQQAVATASAIMQKIKNHASGAKPPGEKVSRRDFLRIFNDGQSKTGI